MTDDLQSQPTAKTFRLSALVSAVHAGDVRVPHFQRSFRWDSRDVVRLFDSILRGFPVGSVLLWQRTAPEDHLQLGAIELAVPARTDALWVVDGQQRITSLVNAVSQEAYDRDERFKLDFDLNTGTILQHKDADAAGSIPLPVMFDLRALLSWIQLHPELADRIMTLNDVAARLQNFELPASLVAMASQDVMQEIFDRMNSSGKRLRRAEIFSALFAPEERSASTSLTVSAIADHIAGDTSFGRIDDDTDLQVVLARRGPDTTRDIRREFEGENSVRSDFANETRDEALAAGEKSLRATVTFLQGHVGVPHFSFLPYRFLLITLSRFLAHFPNPHPRNIELLNRWFWQAALTGPEIFKGSATGAIRALNARVVPEDESGSAQGLLAAVQREYPPAGPNLHRFRTNDSSTRIVLAAMWEQGPRSPESGEVLSPSEVADVLGDRVTALDIAADIVRRSAVSPEKRQWAANRILAAINTEESIDLLFSQLQDVVLESLKQAVRRSHVISESAAASYRAGDFEEFLARRDADLQLVVESFLRRRTGSGYEPTPPLELFDLDQLRDDL